MNKLAEETSLFDAVEVLEEVEAQPRRWNAHASYKPSGMEWLEHIPSHWQARKLKFIADVRTSNVDKKSDENEPAVELCNYVDVYHNDYITDAITFMKATASEDHIQRFSLAKGDVLITKDSEEWDDIAVPACVDQELKGVVCGYHLALVRPRKGVVLGDYLFRAFAADGLRDQFRVRANGITRYGLSRDAVTSAVFPLPPLPEQRSIAAFLRRETAKIDALVEKKHRLIDLLKEKRTSLISHVVTKGLNANAPMKPSGVEWLGDIPEHWSVNRLKVLFENLNNRRVPVSAEIRGGLPKIYPYYGASGVIDYVDEFLFEEPLILVAEDGANLLSRSTPLAFIADGQYWVNNHAHILRPKLGAITYWEAVLQLAPLEPLVTGAAQPKLTKDNLGVLPLPAPPSAECEAIASYIADQGKTFTTLANRVEQAISILIEYRSALVSAAVTGKIDVRDEVAA